MKFPVIRESYFINTVVLILSLVISWFCLLFGLAHLFGERNPNIPVSESILGYVICIALCLLGIGFLIIAITSIKGILYKLKNRQ